MLFVDYVLCVFGGLIACCLMCCVFVVFCDCVVWDVFLVCCGLYVMS